MVGPRLPEASDFIWQSYYFRTIPHSVGCSCPNFSTQCYQTYFSARERKTAGHDTKAGISTGITIYVRYCTLRVRDIDNNNLLVESWASERASERERARSDVKSQFSENDWNRGYLAGYIFCYPKSFASLDANDFHSQRRYSRMFCHARPSILNCPIGLSISYELPIYIPVRLVFPEKTKTCLSL